MSSDRTLQYCMDAFAPWAGKIRVLQRQWSGYRDQRNYALKQAKYEWVFVIDADEECSEELADKIQKLLSQAEPLPFLAYKVKRTEYFLGKPIYYGMWNPSYQDRFFYKKGVYYTNEVHEYRVFKSLVGSLHEPIHHSLELTPEKLIAKMNHYSTIEAHEQFSQGKRTNAFHLIFTFPALAFKTYFYYGAYKDGMHGLVLSLIEGISRLVKHIKIWEIQKKQ